MASKQASKGKSLQKYAVIEGTITKKDGTVIHFTQKIKVNS